MMANASSLDLVTFRSFQLEGRRDSRCLTNIWDALTWVRAGVSKGEEEGGREGGRGGAAVGPRLAGASTTNSDGPIRSVEWWNT